MSDASRRNNFDLIRLIAAGSVVFYHSTKHLGLDFGWLGDAGLAYYRLFPGVPVFFVVSGYLITASLMRSRTLASYSRKRALRIFPALWMVTICSLGLVASFGFITKAVVASPSFVVWLVGQLTFLQIYNPPFLRGFGVGSLNGSLWTIPVELGFYVLLPVLFKSMDWAGVVSRRRDVLLVLIAVGSFALFRWIGLHPDNHSNMILKVVKFSVLPHLYMFLFGVLLQLHEGFVNRRLRGKAAYWLGGYVLASLVASEIGVASHAFVEFGLRGTLACTVLACAYSVTNLSHTLLRENDVSYGLYLVHMPIVNALVQMGWSGERWMLAVPVLGAAAFSLASWRLIEKPALSLKPTSDLQSTIREHGGGVP